MSNRSLATYGFQVSEFLRYLSSKDLEISDTSDGLLVEFSHHLSGQNKSPDTIGRNIRRVLSLLVWLQNNNYFKQTVITGYGASADANAQVTVRLKSYSIVASRGKRFKRNYLDHDAIPLKGPKRCSRAITDGAIDKLWEATDTLKTPFRRSRDRTMLRLLENTGARRIELHRLTIDDIYEAVETGTLCIRNAKKRHIDGSVRHVPISKSILKEIVTYIELDRNPRVRLLVRRGVLCEDHKQLLIRANGNALASEQSISDEIAFLRRMGGLSGEAHPHMFRNRFVTLVINKIHEDIGSRGLSDIGSSVTMKLMSLLGWASESMVQHYNDQYLSESEGWARVVSRLTGQLENSELKRKLISYTSKLKNGHKLTDREIEDLALVLEDLIAL